MIFFCHKIYLPQHTQVYNKMSFPSTPTNEELLKKSYKGLDRSLTVLGEKKDWKLTKVVTLDDEDEDANYKYHIVKYYFNWVDGEFVFEYTTAELDNPENDRDFDRKLFTSRGVRGVNMCTYDERDSEGKEMVVSEDGILKIISSEVNFRIRIPKEMALALIDEQ